jgi:rod shape-determining protein MreC
LRERLAHWLVLGLLLAQLAGLAVQVPDEEWRGSVLEALLLRTVGPLVRAVSGSTSAVAETVGDLKTLERVRHENQLLRQRVATLERELLRLQQIEGDARRLAGALRYARPQRGALQVADVVYADHASWLRTLIVFVGAHPVARNQPVLVPAGLVGRVVTAAPPYAKVQLITDRAAAVGAMLESSRRQGVVRGSGGGGLELAYVPKQAEVREGERVVTSGVDGVYPRGIPVGWVRAVVPGDGMFHEITLTPAVELGALDQVYLLAPGSSPIQWSAEAPIESPAAPAGPAPTSPGDPGGVPPAAAPTPTPAPPAAEPDAGRR